MFDICFISHSFGGGCDKYILDLIKLNNQYNILYVLKAWTQKYTYILYKDSKILGQYDKPYLNIELIKRYKIIHINSFLPYDNKDTLALLSLTSKKILSIHDFGLICHHQHDPSLTIDESKLELFHLISEKIDIIICVSNFVKNVFEKNIKENNKYKLQTIYNADIDILNTNPQKVLTYNIDESECRIALIGSLNVFKGLNILYELNKIAQNKDKRFKFYIIGDCQFNNCSGVYNELTFNNIIGAYKPHILLFPTICDETYSYTYSLALASGIPIFSSHKGSFIERSKQSDKAYTFNTIMPQDWYNILEETYKKLLNEKYIFNLKEVNFQVHPNEINEIYNKYLN
jgi:hypothetical protein